MASRAATKLSRTRPCTRLFSCSWISKRGQGMAAPLLRWRQAWRWRWPGRSANVVLMGQQHLMFHHHTLRAHVAAGTDLGAIHQDRPGADGAPLVQVDIAEFEDAILEAVCLEVADHGGIVLKPEHIGINN